MRATATPRRWRVVVSVFAAALLFPVLAVALSPAGADEPVDDGWVTEWASNDGGSAGRELPAVSGDGRYVVYVGRSETMKGVFLRDRTKAAPTAPLVPGDVFNPAISDDGKVIAYVTYGATRKVWVLEWQKPGAVPEVVSVGDPGTPAPPSQADFPALSKTGRFVAFQANRADLDAEVTLQGRGGGPLKVYVRDRLAGDTDIVSVTTDGVIANGNAIMPDISDDGLLVTFASDAANLAGVEEGGHEESVAAAVEEPGEDEGGTSQQVYLHDRTDKSTVMVSVGYEKDELGAFVEGDAGSAIDGYGPTIDGAGRFVSFDSDATNLVEGDTNDNTDAFVRDMQEQTTVRVSVNAAGEQVTLPNPEPPGDGEGDVVAAAPPDGNGGGGGSGGGDESKFDATADVGAGPAMSGNGLFVAFESQARLTEDDVNHTLPEPAGGCVDGSGVSYEGLTSQPLDIYRHELATGALDRPSKADDVEGAEEAFGYRLEGMTNTCVPVSNGSDAAISRDGTKVAFTSNGNPTGERPVGEEEPEAAAAPDEEEAEEEVSSEPNVFLRRPTAESAFDVETPEPPQPPIVPGGGGGTVPPDTQVRGISVVRGVTGALTNPFIDVLANNVHYEAILILHKWGIVKGVTNNRYMPAGVVTRAQMASFIARMLQHTSVAIPPNPPDAFDDDNGNTHQLAINQLAALGIVQGRGPRAFAPDEPVQRGEAVTLMVRLHERLAVREMLMTRNHFEDDETSVHHANINKAAEAGITNGTGPRTFDPTGLTRRDQMASLLARMLDLCVAEGYATM